MDRLETVLTAIDGANAADPNRETIDGKSLPYERMYAERLTKWVLRLKPDAGEFLRIAARGQHIERWTVPRNTYPMDRAGYLRWREDLKRFHAKRVLEIMASAGYSSDEQQRVRSIILKKNISADPDTQTLEDGLCLVFLETQFEELKRKTPDDKMIDIIRKTWRKMSAQGREVALALPIPAPHRVLIEAALR
jgi:hypothetical protein